jgi:kojibiose phosphorylase
MATPLHKRLSLPEWYILDIGWNPSRQRQAETLLTLGNGYLGSRGALEESPVDGQPGTFFAGLFDDTGAQVTEMINAPNPMSFVLAVGGEKLGVTAMDVLDFRRILDMHQGLLYRETLYRTTIGKRKIHYESLRFFSMANPHVVAFRVAVTPLDHALTFTGRSTVDTSVTNQGLVTEGAKRHFHLYDFSNVDGVSYLCTKTLEKEVLIAYASILTVNVNGRTVRQRRRKFEIAVDKGQTAVFTRYFAMYTSREIKTRAIRSKAMNTVRRAAAAGFDELVARHARRWRSLWQHCDIRLNGDRRLQRALRFNIYHLLIAASPHSPSGYSVGARSLSGEGYRGHVFWDTEIFLLPFYIHTMPDVARKLLEYRIQRIAAAREKARAHGYEGAMFPWESADTGEDVTPTWHKDFDGKVIEIHTMQQEHHITADVAYAAWQYFMATGDVSFMLKGGLELVLEAARFWASRVAYDRRHRRYGVRNVIGPDEFHERVDHNAFTNAMARWTLRTARVLYEQLRHLQPAAVRRITKKLAFRRSELDRFRRIEERMFLPWDRRTGLLEQFEGYSRKKKYPLPAPDANGLPRFPKSIPLEKLQSTQFIKQADVVMLGWLLPALFSRESLMRNFDYYERRTLHKSSLSVPVYACVAARLGLRDLAYRYLRIAAETDLKGVYGNTRDGVHAAAIGGTWLAVIKGFCGVHQEDGVLCFDPGLPRKWKSVEFCLQWQGSLLCGRAEREALVIERKEHPESARKRLRRFLPVRVYGAMHRLVAGRKYVFPVRRKRAATLGTRGHI